MKYPTLLVLWIGLSCLVLSCTQPQPDPVSPTPEHHCPQDYLVYQETAEIWQNSWQFINIKAGRSEEEIIYHRRLPMDLLNEQLAKCPDCTGIRVYYALIEPTSEFPEAPELVIVNMQDCNDVFSSDSLVLCSVGGGEWLDIATARSYVCNWQELARRQPAAFVQTWGFAYDRERLSGELSGGDQALFAYAIHSIDPASDSLFSVPDPGDFRGSLVLDLVVGPDPAAEHRARLNFSLPCPRFCGGEQALSCSDAS